MQADKYGVPRICFVNKMDRMGADFFNTVKMIVSNLGATPAVLQVPCTALLVYLLYTDPVCDLYRYMYMHMYIHLHMWQPFSSSAGCNSTKDCGTLCRAELP